MLIVELNPNIFCLNFPEAGSEDERRLHTLLSRSDELNRELTILHRKLRPLISKDKGINQGNIEQLYSFLKDQVSNGVDLSTAVEDLYDHVYTLVSSEEASQVISILLDMAVLEDEQTMVKRQIFTLMNMHSGGDPLSEAEEAAAFQELDMAIASENKAMFSAADDDSMKSNEVVTSTEAQSEYSSSNLSVAPTDTMLIDALLVQDRADSEHGNYETTGRKDSKFTSNLPVQSNIERNSESNDGAEREAVPSESVNARVYPKTGVGDLLKEIREKHKQALRSLQNIVDGEQLRKVKPLDDRLMLKKLQLADRKKAVDSANSDVDLDTERRSIIALEDEIGEIKTEIEEAQANADLTKEGFVLFPSYGASL